MTSPDIDAFETTLPPPLSERQGDACEVARADTASAGPSVAVFATDGPALVLPPRYQDLGPIASGASGDVRRARDTRLSRVVALKVLRAEHVGSATTRARFLAEAEIIAELQHPGIVAIYDRGELADGRLWFAMKEVRGRTLRAVIHEVHAASDVEGFRAAASGWTFRRLVDAFARIAQAVAYAHSRGVVHRDLKPDNLMVGEFGEGLVMDWGLARRVSDADGPLSGLPAPAAEHTSPDPMTRQGDVLGTPAYMPPEQARGQSHLHGRESDVYSLGAILYHLLAGSPPYAGRSGRDIWRRVLDGPPAPVTETARGGPPIPVELAVICERAMQREISARYADAEAVAREVVTWLDGARRREQALDIIEGTRASQPRIAELRAQAAQARLAARAQLDDVRPFEPVEQKRGGWALEDEATRLDRAALLHETAWLQTVHGALNLDADLPDAHRLLADHYRERLADAEIRHRDDDAARFEALLRDHDRGRHAAFLRGNGAVSLVTEPAGAEVLAERYVAKDRRLVAEPFADLGQTPLREVPLPRGSYLLRIRAPGRAEVRYPVSVERDAHWDGRMRGASSAHPIELPMEGDLGADDVYVPAGWCWTGGDPDAMDALPSRRLWIDAFVIGRFPVTNRDYLAFLNDLASHDREAEALAACPRPQLGKADESGARPGFVRDPAGRFLLRDDGSEQAWHPDWPMILVDWHAASAYARWLAERTGKPWRLPNELEREKASRGVDGRLCPWGDYLEPTFACVLESHSGAPTREPVQGHPSDESPYGARGLGGNVRDWCLNVWKFDGPPLDDRRLQLDAARGDDPDFRIIKGGMWGAPIVNSRAAGRFGGRPAACKLGVGIRVVRSITGR